MYVHLQYQYCLNLASQTVHEAESKKREFDTGLDGEE